MQVKSLLVKIGADTKEFDSAMERSKVSLDKVGKTMAIAGAAITAAMGAMIVKTVQTGDQYDKLSQRIGVSVEMLSGYSHAAELAGTTVEAFGKSVARLSANMVETYQKGTGPAADSFNTLGISVADSSGKMKTSEEVLLEVADRFAEMDDGALKTSAAMSIFGKSGMQLIPMLNAGSAGLRAQREEADRLGITMSTSAARACADLKDNQERLQASLKGVGQQIAMHLIPAITPLVEKITNVIAKVTDWAKRNPELAGAISKVALAIGVFLAAGGTILMILPKLIAGMKLLGLAKMALLGPIGLVVAALAALAIGYMAVKDAEAAAEAASRRYDQANEKLMDKLRRAAEEAGMSAVEFEQLTEKYKNQGHALDALSAKLALAIHRKKEGLKLAEGLAKVSAEQKAAIDAEKAALEAAKRAQEAKVLVDEKAKASLEAMTQLRAALTDEVAKATMSETAYTLYSLDQQLKARIADVQKSALAERGKHALILQAKAAHDAQVAALDAAAAKDLIAKALENRERWLEVQAAAQEQYLTMKRGLQDSINQMMMGELEYTLWALEQERLAKIQSLTEDTLLTEAQKAEIMALLEQHYKGRRQLAEDNAQQLTAIEQAALQSLESLYRNFAASVIDRFAEIGAGGKSLGEGLKDVFKSLAGDALSVVKSVVAATLADAAKSVFASQAKAISSVIASVMAMPFPLNLALVGGAIAAVSALFSRIKLGEGALVMGPTAALIGEKGPELVIPLKKLGLLGAGAQGQGMTFQQTLHFHGNINSALSLDEISRVLGERTVQAIQRGRRF